MSKADLEGLAAKDQMVQALNEEETKMTKNTRKKGKYTQVLAHQICEHVSNGVPLSAPGS